MTVNVSSEKLHSLGSTKALTLTWCYSYLFKHQWEELTLALMLRSHTFNHSHSDKSTHLTSLPHGLMAVWWEIKKIQIYNHALGKKIRLLHFMMLYCMYDYDVSNSHWVMPSGLLTSTCFRKLKLSRKSLVHKNKTDYIVTIADLQPCWLKTVMVAATSTH